MNNTEATLKIIKSRCNEYGWDNPTGDNEIVKDAIDIRDEARDGVSYAGYRSGEIVTVINRFLASLGPAEIYATIKAAVTEAELTERKSKQEAEQVRLDVLRTEYADRVNAEITQLRPGFPSPTDAELLERVGNKWLSLAIDDTGFEAGRLQYTETVTAIHRDGHAPHRGRFDA